MGIRLIAIAWCLLSICAGAKEQEKSDPLVGTVDSSGSIILHVFDAAERGKRPAALTSEYGIVMCRSGDWVRFALGDRAKKTIQEFTSYNDFLEAIKALPKGSTLTIYDRCLMPRFYDFYPVHKELYDKFDRDCDATGLKIAEDPHLTCTCEAVEMGLQAEEKEEPLMMFGKALPEQLHHVDEYSIRDLFVEDVPGSRSFWLGPWVETLKVNGIERFYIIKGYNRFYLNAAFPGESSLQFLMQSSGTMDFYGPFDGKPSDHFAIPADQDGDGQTATHSESE